MYQNLFGTRKDLNSALQYGLDMFEKGQHSAVTTAMMVYGNTMLHLLQDVSKEIDLEVCGMDIVDIADGETKGELAARLYPNMVIDCAVPQYLINKLSEHGFDNPARHLVTAYVPHDYHTRTRAFDMIDGVTLPVTDYGIYMLSVLAQNL